MNLRNISGKTRIIIGVSIAIAVLIVIIVPVAVTVSRNKSKNEQQKVNVTLVPTNTTTTTTSASNPDEKTRIDCYLEAQSRFENLTKYACEKRNCIYNPSTTSQRTPKCYFDREKLGYKYESGNETSYILAQSGKAPFPGVISKIQLDVEYYGQNIVRVKVSTNICLYILAVFKMEKKERIYCIIVGYKSVCLLTIYYFLS